ncbi:unnamed protein product [Didymodactylos carnosus]|uniref:Nitrate/nitrite transporter n=1 Tax=Didymodactylos carnosus TaxID=1234261 RepID=A0A8S2R318_9BILA|nr:unnamed protein product [Didymodactylos carnosus]CAF4135746.1 unnamed protein product [Didymodactylos carnosus]
MTPTSNSTAEETRQSFLPKPDKDVAQKPPASFSTLYQSPPTLNPLNQKATTFPLLKPIDQYGRTFHHSWLGFFVAFLAWFAFPPLLHGTINVDLKLTPKQISNSNIVGLISTLFIRILIGPVCDRYGPRKAMIFCLLAGAIPTAFVPLVDSYRKLLTVRLFVGILGGTFVPCQAWLGQFYENNIIGRVNALAAGWGNAGGGATFFLMPALVIALQKYGNFSLHRAWTLSFVVGPLPIILIVALMTLLFGQDCPQGKWSDRHRQTNSKKPTDWKTTLSVIFSPYTLLTAIPYASTFGAEIAVEGYLSGFYLQVARHWTEETAGRWASLFGLLNIVTRPMGGYLADVIYKKSNYSLLSKKYWMLTCGVLQGAFFVIIGLTPATIVSLLILTTFLAIFMEMGNGANFALVPHLSPEHTGVVSGTTGASGNLGGMLIDFLIFRQNARGKDGHDSQLKQYLTSYSQIGVAVIVLNLICVAIPLQKEKKTTNDEARVAHGENNDEKDGAKSIV